MTERTASSTISLDPPSEQEEGARRARLSAALGLSDAWRPAGWQLVLTGVLLTTLWMFVCIGLGEVMTLGAWVFKALIISATTILVPYLMHAYRGRVRVSAVIVGAVLGFFVWAWMLVLSSEFPNWMRASGETLAKVEYYVLSEAAPLVPQTALVDVFLFLVWIGAVLTALLGLMRPLGAGIFVAALLLVPPAVVGMSAGTGILVSVGVVLALLGWMGSPDARLGGAVAALAAVAIAAGVMTAAPPSQDRVWNESLLTSPVADGVPDVTVALAEDLRQGSDNPVLWVKSTLPGPRRLVLATLSDFEGGHWSPSTAKNADRLTVASQRFETSVVPGEDKLPSTVGWSRVTVTIDGLLSSWLPMPQGAYVITEANNPGGFNPSRWQWMADANTARADGTVTRRDNRYIVDTLGVSLASGYAVGRASRSLFTDPASAPSELQRYLEIPDGLPSSISDAANAIYGRYVGGGADRLSIANGLEAWFRTGGFSYDEEAPYSPGMDRDNPYDVMEALLVDRRGFCVHYASTFAVMARYLGVPTRIAVGYALVTEGDGATVVKSRDLHAWPEVFVDGVGWVAFEPTPGGAWVRASTGIDVPSAPLETNDETVVDPLPTDTPLVPIDPFEEDPGFEGVVTDGAGDGGAAFRAGATWFGIVLGLMLALALIPAILRRIRTAVRRRRIARGEHAARAAWDEFADTLVDLRVLERAEGWGGALGAAGASLGAAPRAKTAEALVDHLAARRMLSGESVTAAERLAERMVAERYGGPEASVGGSAAELRPLLDGLVLDLRTRAGGQARLRARLMPGSVLGRRASEEGAAS